MASSPAVSGVTGRLNFTDDPALALTDADFVFLCVGTPLGPDGAADLSQLESAIQSLAPYLRAGVVIVNKSTVPVGSGNWTRTVLEDALQKDRQLEVLVSATSVALPGCPNWSGDPGYDPRNEPLSNLGCANAFNLGLMVADPQDLSTGNADGTGRCDP